MLDVGGLLTTVLTMFIGATASFGVSILRAFFFDKVDLVATSSACMAVKKATTIVVVVRLGFAPGPCLLLIALMIAFGFAGTLAGRHVLMRIDAPVFGRITDVVLTVLALRFIVGARQS
jgi:uncharacterized membrane protein YfcA